MSFKEEFKIFFSENQDDPRIFFEFYKVAEEAVHKGQISISVSDSLCYGETIMTDYVISLETDGIAYHKEYDKYKYFVARGENGGMASVRNPYYQEAMVISSNSTLPGIAYYKNQEVILAKNDINMLFIGSSFCNHFPAELRGMMRAAGINFKVWAAYRSGCKMQEHLDSLYKVNDADGNPTVYDLFSFPYNTRLKRKRISGLWLEECIDTFKSWDWISIQGHYGVNNFGHTVLSASDEVVRNEKSLAKEVFNKIRTKAPNSKYCINNIWAYGLQHSDINGDVNIQTTQQNNINLITKELCNDNNALLMPCGQAWTLARASDYTYSLTAETESTSSNTNKDDFYHDGNYGGGQYLNACVYFEKITGKSCIGNTFMPPDFLLDKPEEERINCRAMLQEYAHYVITGKNIDEILISPLVSYDNYTLTDSNGVYLTTKEDN